MVILKRIAMIVFGGCAAFVAIAFAIFAIKEKIKRKKEEPWYKDMLK